MDTHEKKTKTSERKLSFVNIYGLVQRRDKTHFIPISIAGWQTKPPFFLFISLLQKEGWGSRNSSKTRRSDIMCSKRLDETRGSGSAT